MEKSGLLFPEVKAQSAGHYVGLNTLLTGNVGYSQGLKVRPAYPTIFEYLRKHAGFKATDTWFIANGIGNSTPLLNSSNHKDYGLNYGANMFAAPVTFSSSGKEVLGNSKTYSRTDLEPMYFMKNFLDQSFALTQDQITSISNTDEERTRIKDFIKSVFEKQQAGQLAGQVVNGSCERNNQRVQAMPSFGPPGRNAGPWRVPEAFISTHGQTDHPGALPRERFGTAVSFPTWEIPTHPGLS